MAAPPARARADYDYLIKLLLIGDSGTILYFYPPICCDLMDWNVLLSHYLIIYIDSEFNVHISDVFCFVFPFSLW